MEVKFYRKWRLGKVDECKDRMNGTETEITAKHRTLLISHFRSKRTSLKVVLRSPLIELFDSITETLHVKA